MDIRVKRFTELCARSRHEGLTLIEHQEKKDIANKLVQEKIMTNNGMYKFTDPVDTEYFLETIKNWKNDSKF